MLRKIRRYLLWFIFNFQTMPADDSQIRSSHFANVLDEIWSSKSCDCCTRLKEVSILFMTWLYILPFFQYVKGLFSFILINFYRILHLKGITGPEMYNHALRTTYKIRKANCFNGIEWVQTFLMNIRLASKEHKAVSLDYQLSYLEP